MTDKKEFRILVCGSREFLGITRDHLKVQIESNVVARLERLAKAGWPKSGITIVHGGAKGVDSIAERVARELGIRTEVHIPAFIDTAFLENVTDMDDPDEIVRAWNRRAPLRRNHQMLKSGVDVVLAFTPPVVTSGTGHTMSEARRLSVPVDHVVIGGKKADPYTTKATPDDGAIPSDENVEDAA
jgi:hypothetical protein